MATKILLKKSSTAGSVPLTADLDQGELAVNLVDRKIYTKNNSGAIVKINGAYVDSVAPSTPAEGDIWYDTANNLLKAYDGSAWNSAGYQTLAALEDTTFTSLTSGDHITWNGSAFVNSNFESDVEGLLTAANTGTGFGDLSYANGVYTFDRVTAGEIRGVISVTDNGGDGALSYDSSTGVISYTGPSASEVRAHLSDGTGVAYNSTTGVIELDFTEFDTSDVVEDPLATTTSGTMYFTEGRARAAISVTDTGGDGSLVYNNSTGVITYTGPSAAEVQAHFSAGTNTTYSTGTFDITDATIRSKISVTDNGGDGALSYNATTGVITYTGPSASEVRAHLSGGTGVTYNSGTGVIAIGQEVETTSNVTFNDITTTGTIYGPATMTLDPSAHGDNTGTVVIAGNLTVNGTTTSVNSNEVNIGDSIIVLNSDETGTPSQNAGFEVERGTAANVAFLWVEADDAWDMGNYNLQNVVIDGGSY